MTDEVVTRLYQALVEELGRRDHPEGRPVKVSDLYQKLVPYRAVRSTLGVELNADYEHALLRLLAGEGSLLRLEPAEARQELQREVEGSYPFVGLFRKFSASDVWVTQPARPEPGPEPVAASGAKSAAPAGPESAPARIDPTTPRPAEAAPPARPAAAPAEQPAPGRVAAESDRVRLRSGGGPGPAPVRAPVHLHRPEAASESSERVVADGKPCVFCAEPLPTGRRVRFCPHCGGDQRLRPCPRCEAVLERDWRYCISCGHEASE